MKKKKVVMMMMMVVVVVVVAVLKFNHGFLEHKIRHTIQLYW
jgi:hypothetical protein